MSKGAFNIHKDHKSLIEHAMRNLIAGASFCSPRTPEPSSSTQLYGNETW